MKGRGRRNNKQKKWIQQNEISEIKQRREEGEENYAYKINTLDEKGKKKTTQKDEMKLNQVSGRKENQNKPLKNERKKKKRRRRENEKERQRPRRNSECPVQTDLTKAPDNIK